jgi:hypothetical protein
MLARGSRSLAQDFERCSVAGDAAGRFRLLAEGGLSPMPGTGTGLVPSAQRSFFPFVCTCCRIQSSTTPAI